MSNNDYGQLGLGDVSTRGDEPDEVGDLLPVVGATCLWRDDGSVQPNDKFTPHINLPLTNVDITDCNAATNGLVYGFNYWDLNTDSM